MRKKKKPANNIRKDTVKNQGQQKKKRQASNINKGVYRGLPHDSLQEKYTFMWLFELEEAGLIVKGSIKRSESYLLFEAVNRTWIEKLKTKSNPRTEVLLAGHLYTPDAVFELTEEGKNCPLFSDIEGTERLRSRGGFNLIHQKGVVHIETKGSSFRRADDTKEKFGVDKKFLWMMHKVFCNLFIPDDVFSKTFTPREYLVTDVTKQPRKIRWKVRSLSEYLQSTSPVQQIPQQKKKRA